MRGDTLSILLGLAIACALGLKPCIAADINALAKEKAAAISIIKSKAVRYTATLAQGRLFSAYMNASTQSEGQRLRERIGSSFKALENRYGMRNFTVIDRTGELFVHVGTTAPAAAKLNIQKDPVFSAAFAQNERAVATVMSTDHVTYASPIVRRGEKEFALSIEQNLSAYDKVLAYGLAKSFYVVVVDHSGNVFSDSRPRAAQSKSSIINGLSLDDIRNALGGNPTEGTGRIAHDGALHNVSYQTVGDWTVVAVELLPLQPECLRSGEDTCP